MGIIVAIAVVVAGAFGAGAKSGLLKKGADTTRQDTYAFERQALEQKLARLETKQRGVYELNNGESAAQTARVQTQREKLEEKITALKQAEEKMATDN